MDSSSNSALPFLDSFAPEHLSCELCLTTTITKSMQKTLSTSISILQVHQFPSWTMIPTAARVTPNLRLTQPFGNENCVSGLSYFSFE